MKFFDLKNVKPAKGKMILIDCFSPVDMIVHQDCKFEIVWMFGFES